MQTHRRRRLALALTLAATASAATGPAIAAPDGPDAPVDRSPVLTAMAMTRERGVPMVLILDARRVPASTEFARQFLASDWTRHQRGLVQVVESTQEDDPQLAAFLRVSQFPTAVLFRRGPSGLVRDQTWQACESPSALARWLDERVGDPASPAVAASSLDDALVRASHDGQAYPSTQGYTPPAQVPAPPQTPLVTAPPAAPLMPQMATTTANVIQVPGQNFVIQQQAPQIFMAPSQAPVVYVPQQQQMMMAPASAPMAPAGNLFLPAGGAAIASAPAPQPTVAVAAQPTVAVAAQPAMGVGVAAQPAMGVGVAAVTNQQLNLPTTASRTRVRVRGPGPFASAAARFGERLTQLGRARIVTEQETTLAAPLAQAAAPGMTTISTTAAVPIAQAPPQPQQPTVIVPPCGHNPPCNQPHPPAPPVDRPTPQGSASPHHH